MLALVDGGDRPHRVIEGTALITVGVDGVLVQQHAGMVASKHGQEVSLLQHLAVDDAVIIQKIQLDVPIRVVLLTVATPG